MTCGKKVESTRQKQYEIYFEKHVPEKKTEHKKKCYPNKNPNWASVNNFCPESWDNKKSCYAKSKVPKEVQ